VSYMEPERLQPRMRLIAWGTIVYFVLAGAAAWAGLVDLHAHAFALLMAFFAVAAIAQAWARQGRGGEING
jgi:hypothetical protein